ncbi:tRNA uridine-5-carboxymethylaminomethyl(34) synthesis GTPase MnmE [Prolixibacter sp. NT017]|uniref:tRNA uridine-5-carboxymethylaminomethyl(34) synthesis GTPase MnmE n=1 Tax=Prolixibacter sp. NT017 TaxID=2652390 RepID=UPI00127E3D27|nr:tRNA uridine-5-carboxymethylaminomethyl(34) synthesis GTPase MnmE [Prolixibacter sp. NT017]GET25092.1 tRNA modification GTPase MnmE [Prolixibacter sp. NT017]
MIDQSTICAISTPPGVGGIAVIRLSGQKAVAITEEVFISPNQEKKLADQPANTLHFGTIRTGEKIIDEVVVSLFRAPHSFTGEDVVEISCHGSQYIQQAILELLLSKGARMAGPGEFTQRAFLNGKMDLSQAEAVADLIASTSAASHKLALNQMRGGFSQELIKLRGELLSFVSLIELELDFSEEDVEFADRTQLLELATRIEEMIGKLADSFKLGNVIKNGIPVTIAGETNVGKSTLLNALLNDERAIVSEIEGTTRDVIEDIINIRGVSFRFIDTAGIRTTADKIESMGIERTYQKIKQASIVLLLLDLTREPEKYLQNLEDVRQHISQQNLIIVGNKADQVDEGVVRKMLMDITLADNEDMVFISAKMGHNIDSLKSLLLETVNLAKLNNEEDVIVTNARHYEALTQARESIQRVLDGIENGITGDFLSQDIRECMHYLGLITGEISTDEVLGNIFRNFCIGK